MERSCRPNRKHTMRPVRVFESKYCADSGARSAMTSGYDSSGCNQVRIAGRLVRVPVESIRLVAGGLMAQGSYSRYNWEPQFYCSRRSGQKRLCKRSEIPCRISFVVVQELVIADHGLRKDLQVRSKAVRV